MKSIDNNSLISVIMGVYNCADTIGASINSILSQSYSEWELIICDDASTDGTYEIVQDYELRFPNKIIALRNDKNSSLAYSLNRCLQVAHGKYIARMDGDDISKTDRFKLQIEYLKQHKEFQLVGTAMDQFDDNYDIIKTIQKPKTVDRFTMGRENPFNHATIMTYRYVYDALQGYTVNSLTSRGEDRDLWYRFFHMGYNGVNIQDALYYVRENDKSIERRTFMSRWKVFLINLQGFKLLEYPRWWSIRLFFTTLVKSITPHFMQRLYRKAQKKKYGSGRKIEW